MTKREKVYQKYDGHCAYCGKEITIKEMQVDHKHPKHLANWVKSEKMRELYEIDPDINGIDNLMPSCRRCNHYKRGELLENFRNMMITLHERLMKIYIVKVAVDYGIIKITPFSGKFYFETIMSSNNTKK
jgi:hypothetical protein